MVGGESTNSSFIDLYQLVLSPFPSFIQKFIYFLLLVLLLFFYSMLVWRFFYKFISKKNLLRLNLNRYNKSERPFTSRIIAISLYFIEYILLIPFIVFFWFSFFTLFMILLSESNMPISTILIISAAVISSIRLCAYFNEQLAEDLAKILPLMIPAILILNPTSFSEDFIINVLEKLNQILSLFGDMIMYFFFIIFIEIILRAFQFMGFILGVEEELAEESNF